MTDCRPLQLTALAALAIHHYEHMLDKSQHHLPYFFAKLGRDESYAWHSEWDFGDACGRFLDSLILCGNLLGERKGREAEEKMKDALRWMQSETDGLFYRMENAWGIPTGANMFDQRSVFLGLLSWYITDNDLEAKERIDRLIQGMKRIGVQREDYICFPFENYEPLMRIPETVFTEHGFLVDPAHYGGGVFILPLAVYYEHTQDLDAKELLAKLTRFIVYHSKVFSEDGSFWSRGRYPDDGHFHSKMGTVAGILRYATCIGDSGLIHWCRKIYTWACSMGSSYGWFPEGTGLNGKEPVEERYRWLPGIIKHSETCCTTDMIHIAIYLAKNGKTEYWDHAEKFANTLIAAQIRDVSWAKTVTDQADTPSRTYQDVPERYKGGFTGRMNPNDFTNNGVVDTMACCCAAGGRGLYLLHEHATECRENRLYLHMWFNKENDVMKVEMQLPLSGVLRVETKRAGDLCIRIPEWLNLQQLQLTNNEAKTYEIEGNYMVFKGMEAAESIQLEFPVQPFEREEIIAGDSYSVTWIGNSLMDIDPKKSAVQFRNALAT